MERLINCLSDSFLYVLVYTRSESSEGLIYLLCGRWLPRKSVIRRNYIKSLWRFEHRYLSMGNNTSKTNHILQMYNE